MALTKHRAVKNILFLYSRLFFSLVFNIFTTRFLLSNLGASDYGIFNLLIGLVLLFSFINSALLVSVQRYLTIAMGEKDYDKLSKIFRISKRIHLVLSIVTLIVIEIFGNFILLNYLKIPPERIETARNLFHIVVGILFVSILSIPFEALIFANEDFVFDAVSGLFEGLYKLASAILIGFLPFDKLLFYGIFFFLLNVLLFFSRKIFCHYRYKEFIVKNTPIDLKIAFKLLNFAGWNFFGALCGVLRIQGIAIVLNIFFGTVINAAYGIASQLANQVSSLSINMLKGTNPIILKLEGSGNREKMISTSLKICKYSFFLISFLILPIIFELNIILKIWLKDFPGLTVNLTFLYLLYALISQLTMGLQTVIQATGKIKAYQVVVGTLIILNMPITIFFFKLGFPAQYAIIVMIAIELIASILRIYFVHMIANIKYSLFLEELLYKISIPLFSILSISWIINFLLEESIVRLFISLLTTFTIYPLFIFFFGLDYSEKHALIKKVKSISSGKMR